MLEYDHDGELCTNGDTTEEGVVAALSSFDGATSFYCALADNGTAEAICCYGDPDRRLLEVGPFGATRVLAHDVTEGEQRVEVSLSAEERVAVPEREVFSLAECVEVMRHWRRTHEAPAHLVELPKSYRS